MKEEGGEGSGVQYTKDLGIPLMLLPKKGLEI